MSAMLRAGLALMVAGGLLSGTSRADDVADEGDLPDAERLKGLDRYLEALDAIEGGRAPPPEFARIAEAIRGYDLPIALLRDLIDAFKQDVVKKRYADFAEVMDYSRRSANPVGRLVLHLAGVSDAQSLARSDAICSALQIVNFWQDVALDWEKGRVYIPREDLERFGVEERQIAEARADAKWRELMAFECARARQMLSSGAPLADALAVHTLEFGDAGKDRSLHPRALRTRNPSSRFASTGG